MQMGTPLPNPQNKGGNMAGENETIDNESLESLADEAFGTGGAGGSPAPEPAAAPAAPTAPAAPESPAAPQVPASPAAPQATTQAAPAGGFSLRDALAKKGYDTSAFSDDSAAAEALLATVEQWHESQPYVQRGQYFAQHEADFRRWQEEQERQRQAPTPQSPVPSAASAAAAKTVAEAAGLEWKVPEYDPRWELLVTRDDQGRFQSGDPTYLPIAQKLQQYYDWQRDTSQKILGDFPGLVGQAIAPKLEALEKAFDERVKAAIQQGIQGYASEQEGRRYVQEREADFYVLGPNKQRLIDPRTGQEQLTPKGQAFVQHVSDAKQMGIPNVRQYVERMMAADEAMGRFSSAAAGGGTPAAAGAAAPAATTEQVAESKKGEFLRKAIQSGYRPSRAGSVPGPNDSVLQSPDATIGEIFDAEAEKLGIQMPRR